MGSRYVECCPWRSCGGKPEAAPAQAYTLAHFTCGVVRGCLVMRMGCAPSMPHTDRVPWGGGGWRGAAGRAEAPPLGSGPPASATSAPALGMAAPRSLAADMGTCRGCGGVTAAPPFLGQLLQLRVRVQLAALS